MSRILYRLTQISYMTPFVPMQRDRGVTPRTIYLNNYPKLFDSYYFLIDESSNLLQM